MTATIIAAAALSVIFHPGNRLTVYERPDSSASIFGFLETGEPVDITVRTADGWLGFDPGTAQAASTGSFRYRWLSPESGFTGSDSIETVWAPKPGSIYAMTFMTAPVYAEPDTASAELACMGPGGVAEVLSRVGAWLQVDLRESPEPLHVRGFILLETASLSLP